MTKQKRYYLKNREKLLKKFKDYYRKTCGNEPREVLTDEERILRNRNRATIWAKDNPGKNRAKIAKRRASKLQQTPKWANLKEIQAFYENCPPGYHVDHIIPLQGKEVRGLHVIENLQYLPAVENSRKSNKFIT